MSEAQKTTICMFRILITCYMRSTSGVRPHPFFETPGWVRRPTRPHCTFVLFSGCCEPPGLIFYVPSGACSRLGARTQQVGARFRLRARRKSRGGPTENRTCGLAAVPCMQWNCARKTDASSTTHQPSASGHKAVLSLLLLCVAACGHLHSSCHPGAAQ